MYEDQFGEFVCGYWGLKVNIRGGRLRGGALTGKILVFWIGSHLQGVVAHRGSTVFVFY